MPINKPSIDNVMDTIENVNAVGSIISQNSGSSITKLAKDLIFTMPVITTNSIPYDDIYPIIKGLEKSYASLFFAAISAEGQIDRDKYKTVGEFLKSFHTNFDLPMDAIESITPDLELEGEYSAVVTEGYMSPKDIEALWDITTEQLDTSLLNNMCLPYKNSEYKLTSALESADTDKYYRQVKYVKDENDKIKLDGANQPIIKTGKDNLPEFEYIKASKDPKVLKKQEEKFGDVKSMKEWGNPSKVSSLKTDAQMINDTSFAAMTPTLLKMTLGNTGKDRGVFSHTFVIGVKTMPRVISSSLIVSNMVEAFKNRAIFKFIKSTKNEMKALDMLFGLTASREYVKNGSKWVNFLRRRSIRGKIPFVGKGINPTTTVIITDSEAYAIKKLCGVDPFDGANTAKMMEKYNMLGFCIYDVEEKMLHQIVDGERAFTTISLRNLIADNNKQLNLDNR